MPPAGSKIGHRLIDINVPKPSKGAAAILVSPNMQLLMGIIGQEVVLRYRATVAKKSGQLMESAAANSVIGGKKNDRYVAHVTVGGEDAVSTWVSERNPNPNDLFFYGVLHEHGSPTKRGRFPAAKDLADVVASMGFFDGG